jgi:hypothetical protein
MFNYFLVATIILQNDSPEAQARTAGGGSRPDRSGGRGSVAGVTGLGARLGQ